MYVSILLMASLKNVSSSGNNRNESVINEISPLKKTGSGQRGSVNKLRKSSNQSIGNDNTGSKPTEMGLELEHCECNFAKSRVTLTRSKTQKNMWQNSVSKSRNDIKPSEYNVLKYLTYQLSKVNISSDLSTVMKNDATNSILHSMSNILDRTDEKASAEDLRHLFMYNEETKRSNVLDYAESTSVKAFHHILSHRASDRFLEWCLQEHLKNEFTDKNSWEFKLLDSDATDMSYTIIFIIVALFYPFFCFAGLFYDKSLDIADLERQGGKRRYKMWEYSTKIQRFISTYPCSYFISWGTRVYMVLCLYKLGYHASANRHLFRCEEEGDRFCLLNHIGDYEYWWLNFWLFTTWIFTFSKIHEEFSEFFGSNQKNVKGQIAAYFSDNWNKFDVCIMITFIAYLLMQALKFILTNQEIDKMEGFEHSVYFYAMLTSCFGLATILLYSDSLGNTTEATINMIFAVFSYFVVLGIITLGFILAGQVIYMPDQQSDDFNDGMNIANNLTQNQSIASSDTEILVWTNTNVSCPNILKFTGKYCQNYLDTVSSTLNGKTILDFAEAKDAICESEHMDVKEYNESPGAVNSHFTNVLGLSWLIFRAIINLHEPGDFIESGIYFNSFKEAIFWGTFFLLIIVVCFNGMVAIMTLSLENDMSAEASRQRDNYTKYSLMAFHQHFDFSPLPFNFMILIYRKLRKWWNKGCVCGNSEENEGPAHDDTCISGIRNEKKTVLEIKQDSRKISMRLAIRDGQF